MRVLVNCPSGESRLLQFTGESTVLELKQVLEQEEDIPVAQQVLVFVGQHLKDHSSLTDLLFTQSDEIVLYLSRRLSNPKLIYLTMRGKQAISELVESDMPIGEVATLLESRCMAVTAMTACVTGTILAKRQDGSTIPITVDPAESVVHFEARVAAQEGVQPKSLTFCQAYDGVLIVTLSPSAQSSHDTHRPIKMGHATKPSKESFARGGCPQPIIMGRNPSQSMSTLLDVSRELCVIP